MRKFWSQNVKKRSWRQVTKEKHVSVSLHISCGFKSRNSMKFWMKVLNMCYNRFIIITSGYDSQRTILIVLEEEPSKLTKKLSSDSGNWRVKRRCAALLSDHRFLYHPTLSHFIKMGKNKLSELINRHAVREGGHGFRWLTYSPSVEVS